MELHHALVIEGDNVTGLQKAKEHVKEILQVRVEGNPDLEIIEKERYTISDARTLKERATQKPLGDTQVFIIVSDHILREAQNALLKLLEEPAQHTYFILVVPSISQLLPTVQSRLSYGGKATRVSEKKDFVSSFLLGNIGERIRMLDPILKSKDRREARKVLDTLESELRIQGVKVHSKSLSEIAFVRQYLSDRSSSLKMLLEHIAIVL
jgi:DNA polymerase III, delta subunit